VAPSLAALDTGSDELVWVGVGNVAAMILKSNASASPERSVLVPRNGVVGYRLPALSVTNVAIGRGDTLFFATDGIRSDFVACDLMRWPPAELAPAILRAYGRTSDDALVLVVRYLGVGA
jgi:hypothetical protein